METGRTGRRRGLLLGSALFTGGAIAGFRLARGGEAAPALDPPVPGETRRLDGRAGPMALHVAGEGRPLLLVHSINAAASAYEVRPLFERLSARHRVSAPDLPGFGFSSRAERRYDIRLYVDAIHDAVDAISAETAEPVDALALSLSSEFLARAALERPERFRTLTFITPTGFDRYSARVRANEEGGTREIPGIATALDRLPLGDAIWPLLVSRASIRFFLRKTFGRRDIDEGLFAYDYATAHQPGAKNAPIAFISGRLFAADAARLFQRLTHPVLMTQATRGDFSEFSNAGWTRTRPNWRVETLEGGALPHFERPEDVVRLIEAFLADPPPRAP